MLFLALVIIPVGLISVILRNDIVKIISFTGGFTGAIIMFILPCVFVLRARDYSVLLFKKVGGIHRSNFKSWVVPVFIFLCGILSIFYSSYISFKS
jgi:hypothetical protein